MENPQIVRNYQFPVTFIFSGALSGFISTLIFTIVHHILISNIWFSFIFMAIAGIISGISIAVSFGFLLKSTPNINWWKYNLFYIIMFMLLALCSVIFFEPVITMSTILQSNGPPDKLIRNAFPMTIIFTASFAVLLSIMYAKKIVQMVSILITSSILMLVLGLNVSIIGLVEIPSNSLYLIFELFLLIILIISIYAISFSILERKRIKGVNA